MSLSNILDENNFPKDLKILGKTCVDPNYPAKSLEGKFKNSPVRYGSDHVQTAGKGFGQLFLMYNENNWIQIDSDHAHHALPNGLVQLAFSSAEKLLVIGAPGDSFSCSPYGPGVGFGTENARSSVMLDLLQTILTYGQRSNRSGFVEARIMAHPDCKAYSAAVPFMPHVEPLVKRLSPEPEFYLGSEYAAMETKDKEHGFNAIQSLMHSLGVSSVTKVSPVYIPNRLTAPYR